MVIVNSNSESYIQWIGLRENLDESPMLNGKIHGFRFRFSQQNQSNDSQVVLRKAAGAFLGIDMLPAGMARGMARWRWTGPGMRKFNQ
jgi:hypothetical protein